MVRGLSASCVPDTAFPAPGPLVLNPSTCGKKYLGVSETWFSRASPDVQRLCRSLLDKLVSVHDYTIVPIEIPFLVEGQNAHAMTILNDAAAVLTETSNFSAANRILLALGRATPATDYLLAPYHLRTHTPLPSCTNFRRHRRTGYWMAFCGDVIA